MAKWTGQQIGDQTGRVAVVTGSNSGIGYEAARQLADVGARVVLACRNPERGEAAVARIREAHPGADVRFLALDLSDLDSVKAFAEGFEAAFDRLDLLINNAGVMVPPLGHTEAGFELQMGVNHFGHFALTGRLLPRLMATPGARVVNVSSQAHRAGRMNFEDLHWKSRRYSKWKAYGQSKLANLLFTSALQEKLDAAGSDVRVTAAHPGWTATDLQRHDGMARFFNPYLAMRPPQGALPTLRAAVDPAVRGGEYFGPHGFGEMRGYPVEVGRTKAAQNRDDAARLWDVSIELTGVGYDALGPSRTSRPRAVV